MKLGIFGFGVVGQGLYHVLQQSNSIHAEVVKFCIKNIDKKRSLDASYFTNKKEELLDNKEIEVIVELIDDADAALQIVTTAMKNGKHVVSANKKMIAENLEFLLDLANQNKVSFLYEGSCCASIPIIRNLEEYYDNDLLTKLEGIFNGSTNFILTKLMAGSGSYDEVLKEAQDLGFAETDPSLDVEGIDAKFKLCILLFHAFGYITKPEDIFTFGITKVNEFDIAYAKKHDLTIKLIAKCKKSDNKIEASVMPTFVDQTSMLANTVNEYNAVNLESAFSESQLLYGKGAGDKPTGSAVLSDISALSYGYRYENKKKERNADKFTLSQDHEVEIYVRFNGKAPYENDFTEITEKYQGLDGSYWKGKITLKKLQQSSWIKEDSINIIAL
ncbi:MAG: homoserine dehydrogenase [Reichenbachiella sp.]